MATPLTLGIGKRSRYRYTNLHQRGSVVEFGVYVPPPEFDTLFGDEIRYTVTQTDIGFFDRICVNVYGSGTEELWWCICRLNGIVDIENDVAPGKVLLLPNPKRITKFLQITGV